MKLFNWFKQSWLLLILLILGFCMLLFSLYDIIFNMELIVVSLLAYAVLIIFVIILIYIKLKRKIVPVEMDVVEEFEKTLEGGLYHFKCPTCEGFFAVKKSKGDNKQYVKMTCPDCGEIGIIPPNPVSVEEEIPEKKSIKANFKCESCGEGITVWAEGTDLYKKLHVYSCPYCGLNETMIKV